MPLSTEQLQRIAGFELNMLRVTDVIGEQFESAKIPRTGTLVYDINGLPLFQRLPLRRGRTSAGYADIAVNEVMAEPLLAVTMGANWDERALLQEASAAAHKGRRGFKYDSMRFVAYSFPKVAVQFLLDGQEVLMLELRSWVEVPPLSTQREQMRPSNFERWSLIDEMPAEAKRNRERSYRQRLGVWETPELDGIDTANLAVIKKTNIDLLKPTIKLVDTREIHYSPRTVDHHPCFELRGQQTPVWCVAASVEMLLNFYRYQYAQPRLAQELGLGTCAAPGGLPYGNKLLVVDTIETLSSHTLDAANVEVPTWNTYQTEVRENRPLISWIPGHSRTVAGYTRTAFLLANQVTFRGLLVYDPWPPTDCAHPDSGGVITTWENFDTQTYWDAFTVCLEHV